MAWVDSLRGKVIGLDTTPFIETLVIPLRHGDKYIAGKYRNILLKTKGLKTVSISNEIAEEAARIRAKYSIHTADSIQMATAIKEGAALFLTNDLALPSFPKLKVLTLEALKNDAQAIT